MQSKRSLKVWTIKLICEQGCAWGALRAVITVQDLLVAAMLSYPFVQLLAEHFKLFCNMNNKWSLLKFINCKPAIKPTDVWLCNKNTARYGRSDSYWTCLKSWLSCKWLQINTDLLLSRKMRWKHCFLNRTLFSVEKVCSLYCIKERNPYRDMKTDHDVNSLIYSHSLMWINVFSG